MTPELMDKVTKYALLNAPGTELERTSANYNLRTGEKLKQEIRKNEKQAIKAIDDPLAREWGLLASALERDIEKGVQNSPMPEIQQLREASNKHHIENIVPTKEQPLRGFLKRPNELKTQKIIPTFIERGKNQDNIQKMELLTNLLGPKEMEMLRFQQLKGGNNQTLSQGMNEAWRNLGPEQRQGLFSGAEQSMPEWERIAALRKMNPESLNPGLNPPTGVKLLPSAITGGAGLLGGMVGGAAAVLPAIAGQIGLGYGLNKLLRDEGFRNKLVKEMLKGPKNYDNLNAMISSSLSRYVPLSANEKSSSKGEY
jgi:hypothetical protein